MIQIEFNYKQQITVIQANLNDIFQNIINNYFQKSLFNPNSVNFLVNGKQINPEQTVESQMSETNKESKKLSVLVYLADQGNNIEQVITNSKDTSLFENNGKTLEEHDETMKIGVEVIEKLFTKEEKYLHEMTNDAISQCHIFLRNFFGPSEVSSRDIERFSKCIEFFKYYFTIKNKYEKRDNNEKNNKLRSIICSIYLCYYIRLTNQEIRLNFEAKLKPILLKLVNNEINTEEIGGSLLEQIKNQDLKNEIERRPEEIIYNFSDFLRIEQDYLINQIELDKGICKNSLLKENVFVLFLSVITSIPLIIIGKPGTSKNLSAQLICRTMKGKYSKNKFFEQFPQVFQIYFQGSESTEKENVERLFKEAETKIASYKKNKKKEDLPIIMVIFDQLELAERSKSNPLEVLYEKLEYLGKEKGVSFVGISNYSLDASKMNRALVLSIQDLDQKLDDLFQTSESIVESIFDNLKKEPI